MAKEKDELKSGEGLDTVALEEARQAQIASRNGGKETPEKSPEAPKGYKSPEQVQQLLSDEKASSGRKVKELEGTIGTLKTEGKVIPGLKAELAEALGVKDDPDGVAALLSKRTRGLDEREAGLVQREESLTTEQETIAKSSFKRAIDAVAVELKVKPDDLSAEVEKMGVTSDIGIKYAAELLAERKASDGDGSDDNGKIDPLTGRSIGTDFSKLSPADKVTVSLDKIKKQ